MKLINKFKTLLVILAAVLCVFSFASIKSTYAQASSLSAGTEIAVTGVSGNLNNVNIKVEFTTNVNLDGTNNALLVGLKSQNGSITEERFIGAATSDVFDANSVAVHYDIVPKVIGTKVSGEGTYTYSFETKEFLDCIVDENIAKLVVIGQKGTEISAEVSFTEVKYSVKFGTSETMYSYNELIVAPTNVPEYIYDIDGHQLVDGWMGDDSIAFVAGSTYATCDIVYTLHGGAKQNHTWNHVNEVESTISQTGVAAHDECSCGAKRLNESSTTLVTDAELVLPLKDHTHTYVATFDWTNATNPGDKPVVTYTCSNTACGNSYVVPADDITIVEKTADTHAATCLAAGSITYTASCTYESIQASEDKTYTLAILDHTTTHHDAVEASLDNTGNVEYWTCSGCEGYYLDADCTQATTAEGVVTAKYTLEEAQVLSTKDLKTGAYTLYLGNKQYKYTFTQKYKSTSLQFKWQINGTSDANRVRFHNYFCGSDKWNETNACWFICDQSKVWVKNAGSYEKVSDVNLGIGLHTIKYNTQAIMNGTEFTGKYLLSVEVDGKSIYSNTTTYDVSKMTGDVFINGSHNSGVLYDISYTDPVLEEATEVSIYELTSLGRLKNVNNNTYTYSTTSTNYSRIFKFNVIPSDFNSTSELIVNLGDENSCRLWLQAGKKNKFFFAWTITGRPIDGYYLDGTGKTGLDGNVFTEIEMGRIRVAEGGYAGKDFIYIKVDGNYLTNTNTDDSDYYSCFYCDPTVDGTYPLNNNKVTIKALGYELYDVDYVEPEYEDADIISVNDLVFGDTYQNGSIDLLANRTYTYTGSSVYGSVIFKGVFNIKATNFTDGNLQGSQIRFTDSSWEEERSWSNECMVWIHPNGMLIPDKTAPNGYIVGSKIGLDKDVLVEIGRLAIMDGETFTGKHYFYIKLDNVLAAEYLSTKVTDDIYSSKVMFFTGKDGNADHIIKNVEIKKTVNIKVGSSYTTSVEVLQSGFITLPEFGTDVVPVDKRIVGWKIDGTDTAFDPATSRVFDDMTIVATIDDFKWKVTFGTEEYYFSNGSDITAPETNPTKAADATNHYTFVKWVDEDEADFATGTKASKDAKYTAVFTATAHSFGNWNTTLEPGCDTKGSKSRTCTCGYEETEEIPAAHKLVHNAASAPTCTQNGTIEYWECSVCHTKFADANATIAITDIVDPAHHTFVHHEAKASSCTETGNIEYWSCSGCDKLFADENGTTIITAAQTVVAIRHELVKVDAKSATCTAQGNIEYYECSLCHAKFSDANGTTSIADADVIVPITHDTVKVDKVEPTCDEDGNIEYYHCKECGKNFDAQGKEVTDVVLKATGNHNYENGKCKDCGAKDPNYVEPAKKTGCGSTVSLGVLTSVLGLAAILVIKRRKNTL